MNLVPIDHLSDVALRQRMHALALNLYFDHEVLSLPGDIADAFKETVEECTRRELENAFPMPDCIRSGDMPPKLDSRTLIRYGKEHHLEELMRGSVSFGPSTLYHDLPNDSQRDHENRRSHRAPNQIVEISGISYPMSDIILHGEIAEVDGTPIFYHLFCASREESAKLCRAFDADGFVRIRDYQEFYDLLDQEIRRLYPKADIFGGSVKYYDDRGVPPPRRLDEMIMHKTIEYLYQREVRFALLDGPSPGERIQINIDVPPGLLELELLNG